MYDSFFYRGTVVTVVALKLFDKKFEMLILEFSQILCIIRI